MKHKLIVLFLIFLSGNILGQNKSLFMITENGKVGYIDKTGKIILKPQYKNGYDFSENLAPVRLNGKYGFIDETGQFVIPPKYDLATSFLNGMAATFQNGILSFIDKNGKVILGKPYSSLAFISKNLAIVSTTSKNAGIINLNSRKLIVDTLYNSISSFSNGVAIVTKKNKPKERNSVSYAVIDSLGNYIVPFKKYEEINSFVDGYARVQIIDENNKEESIDGVIDTKGNLLFKRPYKNHSYISQDFHDGLAVAYLYKYWIPEKENVYSSSEKSYQGYVDLKGEVVLNDTLNEYLKDFSDGRTFIEDKDEKYKLMDTKFNQVGTETYDAIQNSSFQNGYAVVQKDEKWGIIDTNGKYVVAHDFFEIHDIGLLGNYFFYSGENYEDKRAYGIANINGQILTEAIIQDFDPDGFKDGLLKTIVNNRLTYFDEKGNIIWQEKQQEKEIEALDIDYMNRGYFYAFSKPDSRDLGGNGSSENYPKEVATEIFPKDQLSVTVTTSNQNSSNQHYKSYQVNLSNLSKNDIQFNAQDSRLYMTVQAKDVDGKWKNIEYSPSSWCGNSYHVLTLEKNNYWTFLTPVYDGEYKTKLRIAVTYINPADKSKDKWKRKEITIYSNEYSGGVNPGQFWNKRDYFPGSIMDPYND